jgi:hypothetical protein
MHAPFRLRLRASGAENKKATHQRGSLFGETGFRTIVFCASSPKAQGTMRLLLVAGLRLTAEPLLMLNNIIVDDSDKINHTKISKVFRSKLARRPVSARVCVWLP